MITLIKRTLTFVKTLWKQRQMILELSRKDFRKRFVTSYLGMFWAFVNPIVMLVILWFLFTVGFKAGRVGDMQLPFFVWLATAMILWNFFQEAFASSTNVIDEYSFLVRKVNFRLSILPIVKITTALIVHGIFLLILVGILFAYGITPSWHWLQFIYYLFCTFMLVLGLSWLTSALNVFVKDVKEVVGIFLAFGFWLTPIFWKITMIPEQYRFVFKLNPLYYVVEGYRKAFLFRVPLWQEDPEMTLYFWGVTVFFLLAGITVFRKLRAHFADVI